MKTSLSNIWLVVIFLTLISSSSYSQIIKRIELKIDDIQRFSTTKNGVPYDCLRLKNSRYGNIIGNPDLPVSYYTFYIPQDEKVVGITYKSERQEVIFLDYDLIPTQKQIPTGLNYGDSLFCKPTKMIYESNNAYPTTQATIYNINYLDGDIQVVTVEVCPMQYFPKSKKIIYSPQFEIQIETKKNYDVDVLKIHPKKREKLILDVVSSMVENPDAIIKDMDQSTSLNLSKAISQVVSSTWGIPFYEYVIVTSNALKSSFTELLSWKRAKGLNAGIVSIEDILSDPMAVGDTVSHLNDAAGKLRQYLKAGYIAGVTKYALLGGDYSVVPIRYGCGGVNSWDYDNQVDAQKIPSDLYFSDFNGNWNRDGDIYTGEWAQDAIDYAPEIFVGRLLCSSSLDISTWTRKQLLYEKNPGNGDYSYLGRALFTESDEMQRDGQAASVKAYLPSFLNTHTTILSELPSYSHDWPTSPTGPYIIANINDSLYGLISNFNHGGPKGYGTATHGLAVFGHDVHSNIVASDALDMDDNLLYSARPESGNGFDNLTNNDYPAVVYSISCENMPFDDYCTPLGIRNLAEAFTCVNNGGGIAYLGNTRYGWVSGSSSLYKVFLEKLAITNVLGRAEAFSRFAYSHHWLQLTHNLIGCPETPMWTAMPISFSQATVSLNESDLLVNTGGVESKICVTSTADGGQSYCQVVDNVSSHIFTNVPIPYTVVITKPNYIPYVYESDYYLQNENLKGNVLINANNVWAGKQVTSNKLFGPVIIEHGANVIIDSDGVTNLMKGFELQSGAQLEVK